MANPHRHIVKDQVGFQTKMGRLQEVRAITELVAVTARFTFRIQKKMAISTVVLKTDKSALLISQLAMIQQ